MCHIRGKPCKTMQFDKYGFTGVIRRASGSSVLYQQPLISSIIFNFFTVSSSGQKTQAKI